RGASVASTDNVICGAGAPAAITAETRATSSKTWRKILPGKWDTNTLLVPLQNRFRTDEYNSCWLARSRPEGVGRAPSPAAVAVDLDVDSFGGAGAPIRRLCS